MAEVLPMRRKTLSNQSINQSIYQCVNINNEMFPLGRHVI